MSRSVVVDINDTDVQRMFERRLDSKGPDANASSPSKPLAHGTVSDSEALVSLVTALWKLPSELIPPALLELPRDTARVSHLSDLMDIAREAAGADNLSLASEITKHVLQMSLRSLYAQPVHPRMFSSEGIFSTEGIRRGVRDALSDRLSLEKSQGGIDRVTEEALAITLEDWSSPRYASLGHIEHMASTLSDNMEDRELNSSAIISEKRSMVTNLIAIADTVVSVVGRFNGEGCQMISKLDLPVEYAKPVPEYLIEHHLMTCSDERLSDFFNAAKAMIYFGSINPQIKTEPGDFQIDDFHMDHGSMLETGRRILVAMDQLSAPMSQDARVTVAAYGKDRLNLPESIKTQVSDTVRSAIDFFVKNAEQD